MKYALHQPPVLNPLAMILFIPTVYQPVNLQQSMNRTKGDPSNSSPSSRTLKQS